jgi:hypothetical protein
VGSDILETSSNKHNTKPPSPSQTTTRQQPSMHASPNYASPSHLSVRPTASTESSSRAPSQTHSPNYTPNHTPSHTSDHTSSHTPNHVKSHTPSRTPSPHTPNNPMANGRMPPSPSNTPPPNYHNLQPPVSESKQPHHSQPRNPTQSHTNPNPASYLPITHHHAAHNHHRAHDYTQVTQSQYQTIITTTKLNGSLPGTEEELDDVADRTLIGEKYLFFSPPSPPHFENR